MSLEPDTPFTGASQAVIGLIGTLSVAFMQIAAPFASAGLKRFSPRLMLALGGVLFFSACILASFSTQLWQFLLTQGLLLGLATCLVFTTAVTITPTWYTAHRGLAMGIVLAGTGVGGLVWAPAIQTMNSTIGFRMGLRINGSVAAAIIAASTFVLDWDEASKQRIAQEKAVQRSGSLFQIPLVNWRIAKSKQFIAQALGTLLHGSGYYVPLFFFSSYARTLGYNSKEGATFIAVSNACNASGKIVIGYVADRWLGKTNALVLTTMISALGTIVFWLPSTLVDMQSSSRGLFITYSLVYGLFASAYVSLFPTSLVEMFGPAHYASINGILYMLRGFGGLFGTPIAGLLIRKSGVPFMAKAYWTSALLVSIFTTGATMAVCWAWVELRRKQRAS
jgi:MFS family permease